MSTDPLASVEDVEEAWRTLTADEQSRASALIARASRKIRARWSDVDDRISAGTLTAEDVADVVAEMVQTAMTQPFPGAEQFSQAAGPFSQSVKYANPYGRLFFTADMIRVFEGEPTRVYQAWLA